MATIQIKSGGRPQYGNRRNWGGGPGFADFTACLASIALNRSDPVESKHRADFAVEFGQRRKTVIRVGSDVVKYVLARSMTRA
jgi:hypothetical protein